jgi:hypothetical protein
MYANSPRSATYREVSVQGWSAATSSGASTTDWDITVKSTNGGPLASPTVEPSSLHAQQQQQASASGSSVVAGGRPDLDAEFASLGDRLLEGGQRLVGVRAVGRPPG